MLNIKSTASLKTSSKTLTPILDIKRKKYNSNNKPAKDQGSFKNILHFFQPRQVEKTEELEVKNADEGRVEIVKKIEMKPVFPFLRKPLVNGNLLSRNLNQKHPFNKMTVQKKISFNNPNNSGVQSKQSLKEFGGVNKLVIDDDFLLNAIDIFWSILLKLNSLLVKELNKLGLIKEGKRMKTEESYYNLENKVFVIRTLTKFLLQLDDKVIYVPDSFGSEEDFQRDLLLLFEGYDSTKHIETKYSPLCSYEIMNVEFKRDLLKYFHYFNQPSTKRKALIIVDENYNSSTTQEAFDIILNECNYSKIMINELEQNKAHKIKDIIEATQSMRLSTISESLRDKFKVLSSLSKTKQDSSNFSVNDVSENAETTLNGNEAAKDDMFIYNKEGVILPCQKTQPIPCTYTTTLTHTLSNCSSTQAFENIITESKEIFDSIEDEEPSKLSSITKKSTNVLADKIITTIKGKISNKKSMIAIVDCFKGNYEENRSFLQTLSYTVSNSKCPIVIFTNSLSFLKEENIYTSLPNLMSPMNNKPLANLINRDIFFYHKLDNNNLDYQVKVITLTLLGLFFEVSYGKEMKRNLNENEMNERNMLLHLLQKITTRDFFDMYSTDFLGELIQKAVMICYKFKFNLEGINACLKRSLSESYNDLKVDGDEENICLKGLRAKFESNNGKQAIDPSSTNLPYELEVSELTLPVSDGAENQIKFDHNESEPEIELHTNQTFFLDSIQTCNLNLPTEESAPKNKVHEKSSNNLRIKQLLIEYEKASLIDSIDSFVLSREKSKNTQNYDPLQYQQVAQQLSQVSSTNSSLSISSLKTFNKQQSTTLSAEKKEKDKSEGNNNHCPNIYKSYYEREILEINHIMKKDIKIDFKFYLEVYNLGKQLRLEDKHFITTFLRAKAPVSTKNVYNWNLCFKELLKMLMLEDIEITKFVCPVTFIYFIYKPFLKEMFSSREAMEQEFLSRVFSKSIKPIMMKRYIESHKIERLFTSSYSNESSSSFALSNVINPKYFTSYKVFYELDKLNFKTNINDVVTDMEIADLL